MARILIIDDEPQIIRFLSISLTSQGYDIVSAGSGEEGIAQAGLASPDLIILDLGLPDLDGQHVLREIRGFTRTPVIVLSVRESEQDKVTALDQGANDYVVKPFSVRELLARIRRLLESLAATRTTDRITVGELEIDLTRHQVRLEGVPLKLSRKEFALLVKLAEHSGQLVTQSQLLKSIWGAHRAQPHYLRILVTRLRAKLGDEATQPRFIENEPGVGYRLKTSGSD
ncbi:response regulator transcription factor [Natronospirillum operosum]|uniref:Response regulator transcription factor n=1 Tax=Natronospirillum operosum TaxID=2759953 RepID=A0A4Z0W7P3_9GAMM|nr:response regulator transcription factor [Natronospirillum operosum]TGG94084.1 response regulator transcription factor [Natronospirillum operosum]